MSEVAMIVWLIYPVFTLLLSIAAYKLTKRWYVAPICTLGLFLFIMLAFFENVFWSWLFLIHCYQHV